MTPATIGPRQIIAVSSRSVSRFELTISIALRETAGVISGCGCPCGVVFTGSGAIESGCVKPKSFGTDGPVMSASRMPTRKFFRRSPIASIAVTSDLPTPPLPDMIGIVCAIRARPENSPGARRAGLRSASAIRGTEPVRRAASRAATIGSTWSPCARAPCSTVSYLLTPQPLHPSPNAFITSAANGKRATRSLMLVCGAISPAFGGMASPLNLERRGGMQLARASDILAGGCDSPVRSAWGVGGPMFLQASARGAYAFDEEGRRYVDYVMAYGPLLFGHTHPALVTGLDALAAQGFVWGSTHARELRLAERIRAYLPSVERMRFVTTGTEAMMSAVRVARAFTGRRRVLKFAGCYHGHFDLALLQAGASAGMGAGGIPEGVRRDAIVARYNDLDSVDEATSDSRDDLAAILVEPIAGNMGFVSPDPGFLEGLQERARRWGALLVFDEVITWLRFGLEGAQGRAGVAPDLTALGKIMGGGVPIAAFGGRRDVMDALAPVGDVFTGGTHGGNPFCVAMANRVLDLLEAHPEY